MKKKISYKEKMSNQRLVICGNVNDFFLATCEKQQDHIGSHQGKDQENNMYQWDNEQTEVMKHEQ